MQNSGLSLHVLLKDFFSFIIWLFMFFIIIIIICHFICCQRQQLFPDPCTVKDIAPQSLQSRHCHIQRNCQEVRSASDQNKEIYSVIRCFGMLPLQGACKRCPVFIMCLILSNTCDPQHFSRNPSLTAITLTKACGRHSGVCERERKKRNTAFVNHTTPGYAGPP